MRGPGPQMVPRQGHVPPTKLAPAAAVTACLGWWVGWPVQAKAQPELIVERYQAGHGCSKNACVVLTFLCLLLVGVAHGLFLEEQRPQLAHQHLGGIFQVKKPRSRPWPSRLSSKRLTSVPHPVSPPYRPRPPRPAPSRASPLAQRPGDIGLKAKPQGHCET